jgi:hypothetical protein
VPWLLIGILTQTLGTAATAGAAPASDDGAVYRYRDSAGMEHYVNHLEMVPKGIPSKRVDLGGDDLNPELAHEIAENAHRAAEEAQAKAAEELKARAADAAQRGNPSEPLPPPPAVLPPEARLVLIWAIAFTAVFVILRVARGFLLRSPTLASAFQPLRWGCGAAAILSWILLATLARGWIVDHFAPLHSIKQAEQGIDAINRKQRESERELDKALNNGK